MNPLSRDLAHVLGDMHHTACRTDVDATVILPHRAPRGPEGGRPPCWRPRRASCWRALKTGSPPVKTAATYRGRKLLEVEFDSRCLGELAGSRISERLKAQSTTYSGAGIPFSGWTFRQWLGADRGTWRGVRLACGFHLDDADTSPDQIDKAALLKRSNSATSDRRWPGRSKSSLRKVCSPRSWPSRTLQRATNRVRLVLISSPVRGVRTAQRRGAVARPLLRSTRPGRSRAPASSTTSSTHMISSAAPAAMSRAAIRCAGAASFFAPRRFRGDGAQHPRCRALPPRPCGMLFLAGLFRWRSSNRLLGRPRTPVARRITK